MQASILLLPSELRCLIVELSSGSRNSLAALALTHSSYQREAEKALYDTLYILFSDHDSLKCLETLATNPEKAALVRFLTIECSRDNIDENLNRRATTYLSKILINMHSLTDFRVTAVRRLFCGTEAQMMKGLGKNLCEGHFRLQTLHFHGFLDISQILKNQTE